MGITEYGTDISIHGDEIRGHDSPLALTPVTILDFAPRLRVVEGDLDGSERGTVRSGEVSAFVDAPGRYSDDYKIPIATFIHLLSHSHTHTHTYTIILYNTF